MSHLATMAILIGLLCVLILQIRIEGGIAIIKEEGKHIMAAIDDLNDVTNALAEAVSGVADRFAALAASLPADNSEAVEADVQRLRSATDALKAIGANAEQPVPPAATDAAEAASGGSEG